MTTLRDRVAVVTGASSGIGKSISLALGGQGVTLCLVGRNRKTLESVAEVARATSSRVIVYEADLAIEKEIRGLAARLEQDCTTVDILVHSAGAYSAGRTESAPIETFERQFSVNVMAPYMLTQALLPMLRASHGQIVFINSSAADAAKASVGQYAATKHALRAVADSLREEVNAEDVRVLSVFLGRTATPMQAEIHRVEGKPYHPERLLQAEDVASVVVHALRLPRTAEVTDIRIRPMNKP